MHCANVRLDASGSSRTIADQSSVASTGPRFGATSPEEDRPMDDAHDVFGLYAPMYVV